MRQKIYFSIVIISILYIVNVYSFSLSKKINQAMKKAKSMYEKNFGKETEMNFLGYDTSKYPGTNKHFRNIQIEKWQKYYDCLKTQKDSLNIHKSITPEAIIAREGDAVILECNVCISPAESENIESVIWEWSHTSKKFLEPIEYDEHTYLSPEDKSLHLYNVGFDHIGQYVCKLGVQLIAPYFLTVTNSENLKMVHPKTNPNGPFAEPAWRIHPNIILDSLWSPWTSCSKCNAIGKRYKYGYCTIIYSPGLNSTDETNNTQIEFSTIINEMHSTTTLTKSDKELLEIFQFGIPCRSHILPLKLSKISQIQDRPSEIMSGYCKTECAKEDVFIVKDKNGNIIETANNSAGIYSMLQGLPPIEPPVERRLIFGKTEDEMALTCPGSINPDLPMKWQIASKNIIPKLLLEESQGRMYITITEKIFIKKLKLSDSNIYSCWQNEQLIGSIRLVVEKKIRLNFKHHIILLGVIVIYSVFIYVILRAFQGRKYAKVEP